MLEVAASLGVFDRIRLVGRVSDAELRALYSEAYSRRELFHRK